MGHDRYTYAVFLWIPFFSYGFRSFCQEHLHESCTHTQAKDNNLYNKTEFHHTTYYTMIGATLGTFIPALCRRANQLASVIVAPKNSRCIQAAAEPGGGWLAY